jgi:hypothetical protein
MTASHMALHGMLRLIALSNTGMAALTALMVAAAESAGRCSCASAIATTAGCATPPGHGDPGGGQPRLVRREWWDARRCEKGMGLGLGLGLGLGTAAKLSRRTCTRECLLPESPDVAIRNLFVAGGRAYQKGSLYMDLERAARRHCLCAPQLLLVVHTGWAQRLTCSGVKGGWGA